MNERIIELQKQAYQFADRNTREGDNQFATIQLGKFAELLIEESLKVMQQEWYDLNNAPVIENESPRDVGFRVGKKSEINVLMAKIKTHFGVTE